MSFMSSHGCPACTSFCNKQHAMGQCIEGLYYKVVPDTKNLKRASQTHLCVIPTAGIWLIGTHEHYKRAQAPRDQVGSVTGWGCPHQQVESRHVLACSSCPTRPTSFLKVLIGPSNWKHAVAELVMMQGNVRVWHRTQSGWRAFACVTTLHVCSNLESCCTLGAPTATLFPAASNS